MSAESAFAQTPAPTGGSLEKPFINPLQNEGPPPSSTAVEPPRSPERSNPNSLAPNGTATYPPAPYPPVAKSKSASPFPGSQPTQAGTAFDPIPSSSRAGDAMDVDRAVSPNSAGTKRPGDNLAPDAKRVKEGSIPRRSPPGTPGASVPPPPSEAPPPPPSAPAPAPPASSAVVPPGAPPVDPNAPPVIYPWTNFEPTKYVNGPGPTTPWTFAQHKFMLSAVRSLIKSNNSANFRHPVDIVLFNIPHYPNIIDRPMDLGTIETKLIASDPRGPPKDKSKAAKWDTSKGTYASVSELTRDVRQIWDNTRKFNGRDHVVSQLASKLEEQFEKALRGLPADVPPPAAPSPVAPPSRRASISQTPTIRRDAESGRPKREIHPPPSKDINYDSPGSLRKPKRRNDPQIQWAARVIGQLEKSQKYYDLVAPFLFPVSEIIAAIPSYTQVIKKPIDFLMIKQRLEDNVYEDVSQIDADMRQMCNNARTFNPPGDTVHNAANGLLQMWTEKYKTMPPKQEIREQSEDAVAEDDSEDEAADKDVVRLREAKAERAALDREIIELEQKIARKPPPKQRKPKTASKPKAPPRKYSTTSKASPGGPSANGAPKKQRKPKPEPSYREDDESEDEVQTITIQQKQELADKIQTADADILGQAVQIIQSTTNISGDQEIELDIDSLPPATVIKLYNLVCKGRKRGKKAKPPPRKSGFGGAPGRKHLNEQEEADRIRKMEAQLQAFDSRGPAQAYDEESSSEEESSDEE